MFCFVGKNSKIPATCSPSPHRSRSNANSVQLNISETLMCFSGDFASKQMASTRPLSVLSRSLSLRLLKKPPVWYCPRIFELFISESCVSRFKRRPIPPSSSASPPSFKVHDVCTPVLRGDIVHPVVLAADILQGDISTFQGSSFLKRQRFSRGRRATPSSSLHELASVFPKNCNVHLNPGCVCRQPVCSCRDGCTT